MNKVNQWKDDEIPYKKNNTVHLSKFLLETGVPDFHLVVLTFMRKRFKQSKAKLINYSFHQKFSNAAFFRIYFIDSVDCIIDYLDYVDYHEKAVLEMTVVFQDFVT